MSLIDDALKRAREEAALQEAAKRPGASRWAPSHVPSRRRSAWRAAAALAAVFLAGSAAAWLLLGRSQVRLAPSPAERRSQASLPPARPAAPEPASPERGASPARSAASEPALPERDVPPVRARTRRGPAEGVFGGSSAPPAAPQAQAPPAASKPASSSAPARTFVRSATLPGGETIELGGIVYSESNPVALVNGKVVAPGGVVGNYTVVQIRPEGVDFSGNGAVFSILLR